MSENIRIQDLLELGLTERESKVYLALAQLGTVGVSDILKIATVPKSKIYEILQTLSEKGLCFEKNSGYGKRYQAVDPAKALHGLIRKREDELAQLKKKTDQTVEKILEIYRDPSLGEPFEFIQIVKNPDHIMKLSSEWTKSAKKEILEFVKPPFVSSPEALKDEPKVSEMLIEKGVRIRLLIEPTVLSNRIVREGLIEENKIGAECRFAENLPLKMGMTDSIKVLILMMDPIMFKPLSTALFIEHPGLASTLKFYFEFIWEKATPLREYIGE